MIETIKTHLEKHYQIPVDENLVLERYFEIEEYRKKEFLIRERTISRNFYLVLEGYLRSYHIADQGEEITTEILRTGDLAASMYSILKNEYAYENIQCITDVIVCKISEETFEDLCLQNPVWFQLGMKFLKADILKKEERIRGFAKLKASDRYKKLLNERPDIVQNVPIQYLASYLGIKPESLSRLRGQYATF